MHQHQKSALGSCHDEGSVDGRIQYVVDGQRRLQRERDVEHRAELTEVAGSFSRRHRGDLFHEWRGKGRLLADENLVGIFGTKLNTVGGTQLVTLGFLAVDDEAMAAFQIFT